MTIEKDKMFFRNYRIVIAALAMFIILVVLIAHLASTDKEDDTAQRSEEVAARTAPVGKVTITNNTPAPAVVNTTESEPSPAAADVPAPVAADDTGKRVYSSLCFSCHGTKLPGVPQLGDAASWKPVIEKGMDTLYLHALEGFTGTSGIAMPARGGNPNLTDDEVKAAVNYLVDNSR